MVPAAIKTSIIGMTLFAMNIIGGNVTLAIDPLEKAIGYREALYLFWPLLAAIGKVFWSAAKPRALSFLLPLGWHKKFGPLGPNFLSHSAHVITMVAWICRMAINFKSGVRFALWCCLAALVVSKSCENFHLKFGKQIPNSKDPPLHYLPQVWRVHALLLPAFLFWEKNYFVTADNSNRNYSFAGGLGFLIASIPAQSNVAENTSIEAQTK